MEQTKEQTSFLESVARNTKDIDVVSTGFSTSCETCRDAHGFCCVHAAEAAQETDQGGLDEGHFSWSACECCGSHLGGDRYAAHGWTDNKQELVHLDVCVDCLMFIANGDLPDKWRP